MIIFDGYISMIKKRGKILIYRGLFLIIIGCKKKGEFIHIIKIKKKYWFQSTSRSKYYDKTNYYNKMKGEKLAIIKFTISHKIIIWF